LQLLDLPLDVLEFDLGIGGRVHGIRQKAAVKKEKQIPCGLKPARNDKNETFHGTAKAVPFQRNDLCGTTEVVP